MEGGSEIRYVVNRRRQKSIWTMMLLMSVILDVMFWVDMIAGNYGPGVNGSGSDS